MAEVKFMSITKKFKDITVLENLNLTVKDKEFTVIVGPSGCGKTTLLRMLAGLEEITSGEIFIDNLKVNDLPPSKREIAMVFQDYALYPHMTVKENMSFALKLKKINNEEIDKRVNEAANILKISHLLDRMPRQLSGGQRQRVAIGRAIVRHPKVFLFDEPLSNLDAKLREEMRIELLKLYQKLSTTMIYVTHDQIEAMTLASKIVVMNKGIIQQEGSPIEIYKKPANVFVASFIGTPTINLIKGCIKIKDDKFYFSKDEFNFYIPVFAFPDIVNYVNKEIILGIRPEDVILDESKIDKTNLIEGIVDVVELLGHRENIYIKVAKDTILCATSKPYSTSPGIKMSFSVNYPNLHFFDLQTEKRLN
ncbi:MAG: sn-glycerol-3-phosphate ABC transporter ATP-binding protein UgpC [Elusimicrobiales bacterium]|nr:sn-glycerol-3-phosphate ABC transporter ATP-binding protein UgpC [Elusimicrobiales bacterium]